MIEAGVTYLFNIQLVDIYSNHLIAGKKAISILAVYQNSDAWPSPIGIPDLLNWQWIYGQDIAGIASSNNDGSY
jgi:hypothetical protein